MMNTSGRMRRVLTGIAAVTTSALACAGLLVPSANAGPASHLLINEVYGGGGNSGATLTHDFVELVNTSDQPIDLAGLSLQYASATGGSWQVTPLTGITVPAGGQVLIGEATGADASASGFGAVATGDQAGERVAAREPVGHAQ